MGTTEIFESIISHYHPKCVKINRNAQFNPEFNDWYAELVIGTCRVVIRNMSIEAIAQKRIDRYGSSETFFFDNIAEPNFFDDIDKFIQQYQ